MINLTIFNQYVKLPCKLTVLKKKKEIYSFLQILYSPDPTFKTLGLNGQFLVIISCNVPLTLCRLFKLLHLLQKVSKSCHNSTTHFFIFFSCVHSIIMCKHSICPKWQNICFLLWHLNLVGCKVFAALYHYQSSYANLYANSSFETRPIIRPFQSSFSWDMIFNLRPQQPNVVLA